MSMLEKLDDLVPAALYELRVPGTPACLRDEKEPRAALRFTSVLLKRCVQGAAPWVLVRQLRLSSRLRARRRRCSLVAVPDSNAALVVTDEAGPPGCRVQFWSDQDSGDGGAGSIPRPTHWAPGADAEFVAFSADARWVAVGGPHGAVHLFDGGRRSLAASWAPTDEAARGSSTSSSRAVVVGVGIYATAETSSPDSLSVLICLHHAELMCVRFTVLAAEDGGEARPPARPVGLKKSLSVRHQHGFITAANFDPSSSTLALSGGAKDATGLTGAAVVISVWSISGEAGGDSFRIELQSVVHLDAGGGTNYLPVTLQACANNAWTDELCDIAVAEHAPPPPFVHKIAIAPHGVRGVRLAALTTNGQVLLVRDAAALSTTSAATATAAAPPTDPAPLVPLDLAPHLGFGADTVVDIGWFSRERLLVLAADGRGVVLIVSPSLDASSGTCGSVLVHDDAHAIACACDGRLWVCSVDSGAGGAQLSLFRRRDPSALMMQALRADRVDDALRIAVEVRLDSDPILKAYWNQTRGKAVGTAIVAAVLPHVRDNAWVVRQTMQRVGDSFQASHELLTAGLEAANKQRQALESHLTMTDGCRSGRGRTVVKVVGDVGETAASNPEYTWSQTADEVTLEMPVRSQTERRGFVCAMCRTQRWLRSRAR